MRVCVCLVNYNKWIYVKPNLCQYHIYLITQQPNSGQDLFVTGWAENNLFGISELIFRMGEVGFNPINSIPHTESQKKGQWQIFFHKLHNFISCNFNRLEHCNSYLAYNFPLPLCTARPENFNLSASSSAIELISPGRITLRVKCE